MQKYINLVDLVKSFPTSIYLQKSASIQPRTSLSKFGGKFNSLIIRLLIGAAVGGGVGISVGSLAFVPARGQTFAEKENQRERVFRTFSMQNDKWSFFKDASPHFKKRGKSTEKERI